MNLPSVTLVNNMLVLVSVLMTFSLTMKATHAISHKYKKVLFFIQDKKIKY